MTIRTTLVIPAFNESSRLAAGYERLRPVLETLDPSQTEVIVVDDGSSDNTMDVAHQVYGDLPEALFLQQPVNRGKGAAVRLGITMARGDAIVATDADMSIRPAHIPEFVQALAHTNIVPGSRAEHGHIKYDSPLRTLAGTMFNRLVCHYTGVTLRDTQCGCKGFQRGPARLLALMGMIDRFSADAEMFYLAHQLQLTVKPLHVGWDDIQGSSVRLGRDSLAMIQELRALSHTRYENPVVELAPDVNIDDIAPLARQTRAHGLVVARGADSALLVLPRDGSLAGLTIAEELSGTLRTAGPDELKGRIYDAV